MLEAHVQPSFLMHISPGAQHSYLPGTYSHELRPLGHVEDAAS